MKKVLSLAAAVSILAVASLASAAGIATSKHNLSSTGTGNFSAANSQICVYCHAPHGAKKDNLLWNRNDSTVSFRLYSGAGMASTSYASGFTADSTSLFCMSCHDGNTQMDAGVHSVSIDNFGKPGQNPGTAGMALATGVISSSANLGSNLKTTHPVNFPVTATDSQGDLWVGSNGSMGGGTGAAPGPYPLFKLSGDRATNRSLECGSCHAVHDATIQPFLRGTLAGSALCLGCHNK